MAECNVLIPVNEEQDLLMIDNNAPLLGTHQYGVCWNGGTPYVNGQFYPFRFNIVGKITSSIDASGNVIVTIKNLRIVPSGTGDSYFSSRRYAAPWYGSISSAVPAYRAIALAVVTSQSVPGEGDASWHKCLGGWYAAGVSCGSGCGTDRYGNAPGGTWGYWNDREATGTAWDQSQYQSFARNVPDQVWNLGQIAPTNGNTATIWVIAHAQQGVGYGLGCNIGFAGNSYVAGLSFQIPVLQLCPPEFDYEEQVDDVCNNCDDLKLCFSPSELGGQASVNLVVDYKYKGQSWDQAMTRATTAYKDEETCITLPCLIGDRDVVWRARYELTSGYTAHSEWTDGSSHTLFIPSVGMIVPNITEEECTKITQGKYIEHFDHEVSYYG